jgi:hypothetical protein
MGRPRLLLAPLLCACALALGACGGLGSDEVVDLPKGQLDKSGYIDAFERSSGGLEARYGVKDELPPDASPARQAARVAGLQRVLRAWADRLASLRPPAEARTAHVRFIAGVRSFATDLERPRTALERGDERGAKRLFDSGAVVSKATRDDLVAARRAFHELGYRIRNLDTSPVETPAG